MGLFLIEIKRNKRAFISFFLTLSLALMYSFCYTIVMTMTVEYTKTALKGFRKVPAKAAKSLMAKIEVLADVPRFNHGWATEMVGMNAVRIRQGDYRAICQLDEVENTLIVLKVAHRKEVYK